MPYPAVTFATFDDLLTYINTYIVTNGMQLIEGVEHNAVENGLLTFVRKSPLNWEKARIISTGGAVSATRPIMVFTAVVPTSLTWPDNIYNEYVFINATNGAIPSNAYFDINLTELTSIPANSIVNIVKTSNDQWIVGSVPSSGSSASVPPYVGEVDGGGANDPVSGTSIFQNNSLIGLGSSNGGKITILYAEQVRSNFGLNKTFEFDNVTGEINLDYNGSGETWSPNASLWIDRNQ